MVWPKPIPLIWFEPPPRSKATSHLMFDTWSEKELSPQSVCCYKQQPVASNFRSGHEVGLLSCFVCYRPQRISIIVMCQVCWNGVWNSKSSPRLYCGTAWNFFDVVGCPPVQLTASSLVYSLPNQPPPQQTTCSSQNEMENSVTQLVVWRLLWHKTPFETCGGGLLRPGPYIRDN